MRAARIDSTHAEIVDAFRRLGYRVKSVASLKKWCDLVVQKGDHTWLIEAKSAHGKPTLAQQQLARDGWVIYTVRSVGEVVTFALDQQAREVRDGE